MNLNKFGWFHRDTFNSEKLGIKGTQLNRGITVFSNLRKHSKKISNVINIRKLGDERGIIVTLV